MKGTGGQRELFIYEPQNHYSRLVELECTLFASQHHLQRELR